MSKINLKHVIATVAVVVAFFSSCMKKMDMGMQMQNINYPAAYVVNGEDASLSVIKLETNEVSATVSLMGVGADMVMWPHHISSHGSHLAIGVPGMDLSAGHAGGMAGMKGKLLVIDAVTGMNMKSLELPVMNHNAIYTANGSEIWTSQMEDAGKVLVYDASTYALKNTINVGKKPAEVTFSSDGSKAYVANGEDNSVSIINTTTKAVIATVAVGLNPVGAWTGSNGKMFVDNEDGKSISVIDVPTNVIDQTIALGFMPGVAAHNGTKSELWVSDPMAGKIHYWMWDTGMNMWMHGAAFATGAGAHAITFTPDGNTAYVTNQTANTVSVINVASHTVTKTINVGKKPNGIVVKQ